MKNRDYKIQVLTENYNDSLQDFSAGEYEEEFVEFCNAL